MEDIYFKPIKSAYRDTEYDMDLLEKIAGLEAALEIHNQTIAQLDHGTLPKTLRAHLSICEDSSSEMEQIL